MLNSSLALLLLWASVSPAGYRNRAKGSCQVRMRVGSHFSERGPAGRGPVAQVPGVSWRGGDCTGEKLMGKTSGVQFSGSLTRALSSL